jgi:hypothetical protein
MNPDDGSVCGVGFRDISLLNCHVKKHYESGTGELTVCAWNGCGFMTRERDTIVQHILFHPFHAFLKLLGAELQQKLKLPYCQIDEDYKNIVPPLSAPLRCNWDDGKCGAIFEGVTDFFLHVRDHVIVQDKVPCRCKWKGG